VFERFTGQAHLVLDLARDQAERCGHRYLGPEHVLLGVVAEGQSGAARVLRARGVELAAAWVELLGLGRQGVVPAPRPSDVELLGTLGIDLDTVRQRRGPAAPSCTRVVIAGRATSVPFTAVLSGIERTPTDNIIVAVACAVRHVPRWRSCSIWLWGGGSVGGGLHRLVVVFGCTVTDPVAMMAIMGPTIRALTPADIAAVVEFSLRAWAPVFESFRTVLGERVYQALYPDWSTTQARAVEAACQDGIAAVWVAEQHGRPVGYVAVRVESDDRRVSRPAGGRPAGAAPGDRHGVAVIRGAAVTRCWCGAGGRRNRR
jgi:ClpA/ClpB-like protein